MKKITIIFFSVFCLIMVLGTYLYINKAYYSSSYNDNKFSITLDEHLLKEKLKIYQGNYKINRNSDTEMLKNKTINGKLIFDEKLFKQIENDYGENDFLVIYDDEFYYQFRHFKTWNRQVDSYDFSFKLINDTIFFSADIKGTNPLLFAKPLNLIKKSHSLNCNYNNAITNKLNFKKELNK